VNVPHSTAAGGGPAAKLSVALSRSPYTASGAVISSSVLLAQARSGSEAFLTVIGPGDAAVDDETSCRVAAECDATVPTGTGGMAGGEAQAATTDAAPSRTADLIKLRRIVAVFTKE